MMQIALDAPTRPALRYYGGKHSLAPWIISFFPPHLNYVEPCAGACSVLLQKPRSPLETINDLNGDIVNFFQVLRDRPDELIRKIELTPWARAEYELSLQPCDEPVEKARRFFARSGMSFNGATSDNKRTYGWRHTTDHRLRSTPATDFVNHALTKIAGRLTGVQIECRDWAAVTKNLDNDASLIYLDPPYIQDKRTQGFWYLYEWTDKQHIAAADLLHTAVGYVVLSGYACPLYADLYEAHGWQRHDKEAQTNSGGKRIESVWLSPRTIEALAQPRQGGLFA